MRCDLLGNWTGAYERGEIELKLQVFASGHAVSYDKAFETPDMATGDYVVTNENAVFFDEAWEFTEDRKETMQRLFDGIGGAQFPEGPGEYAGEYRKDATA